jgi:hypothetical protein
MKEVDNPLITTVKIKYPYLIVMPLRGTGEWICSFLIHSQYGAGSLFIYTHSVHILGSRRDDVSFKLYNEHFLEFFLS